MTGNMFFFTDYKEINGGYVAFEGNLKGGKITGRGTIKTGKLDFENVYFVKELKFNLFSASQICDKKNSVLFNDTKCIVLSPNFKLIDESQVLLRVLRKNNMYSVDLKNIVPKEDLTCNFAKATCDDSKLWHRMQGHLNFKTMNKLVKGNLGKVGQGWMKSSGGKRVLGNMHLIGMDVKSAFLYGKIEEEVYVCQPPGFKDLYLIKCKKLKRHYMDFIKLLEHEVKNTSTPMETQKPLLKDEDGKEVDVHMYRSMIGSLMYLTSLRPDIMYLKGQPKFGLWYLKDSSFDLVAYTDSDYAETSLDRKSPTGGCQFLRCRLISWQCKKQTTVANSTTETEYVAASSCHGQATIKAKTVNEEGQLQALVDGKKILLTESTIIRDLQLKDNEGVDCLPNTIIFKQLTLMGRKVTEVPQPSGPTSVADEGVNEEMDDSLERATTTATSLDADSGGGSRAKKPWGILFLKPETTKSTQAMEIESLKRIVNKLERRKRSRTHGLKRLYKVGVSARVESFEDEGLSKKDAFKQERIVDIDANEDIILVSTHDEQMFDVDQDLGDYQLAKSLQAEEQQELNDEDKAKLVMKLFEKKRKFLAAKRAEEKRNKPPTQAQQRKIMCTYLKNTEGKKLINLKNKSFDSIQKMFERALKRVNTFVDYRTKLVEESSKKAKEEVTKGKDVETLWKLGKAKYGSTRLERDCERVLWGDLKVMFEPHIEELQEKIASRHHVINHLEKVRATPGWLMHLNKDKDDDVSLLGLLDTFVQRMYQIVCKKEKDVRELDY
nr:uncharacterized mitochondrial protein AtMg00810-like [Tanacetum cinerariifolium]